MSSSPQKQKYGWAQVNDDPLPVSAVQNNGGNALCPHCGQPMRKVTAGRGSYFVHQNPNDEQMHRCTPENIARKAAPPWLIATLRGRLTAGDPCPVEWKVEQRRFQTNLLANVSQITECQETQDDTPDVALLDAQGVIHSILALNIAGQIDQTALDRLFAAGIPTLVLPSELLVSGQADLPVLLDHADLRGPWWLDTASLPPGLETRPTSLRIQLFQAVSEPPYYFCGPLVQANFCRDVLLLYGHPLWLSPDIWQAVAGKGMGRHPLGDETILIQEWPQQDGSLITAFYVTRHHNPNTPTDDERAVGIRRRFPKNSQDDIRRTSLSYSAFRPDATAVDIACALVTGQ
jgi:hypothetical protein